MHGNGRKPIFQFIFMSISKDFSFRNLLAPAAFVYGAVVRVRNLLFNSGVFSSRQYPIPVISVGNLTVGGTGKTPHVEWLVRQITSAGYRVAVLSRGYKRVTKGYVRADRGRSSLSLGDESWQIWSKFPNVIVVVDEDRRHGIEQLLALPEEERPQVILLDDAFQHRWVKPSFSILLTDARRLFYQDKLLPMGRLREPAQGVSRSDIIIVTKCDRNLRPIEARIMRDDIKIWAFQEVFFSYIAYSPLSAVFADAINEPIASFANISKDTQVVVMTGIVNHEPLMEHLETMLELNSSDQIIGFHFADHHAYSSSDFERVDKHFRSLPADKRIIITTEKDAARLIACEDILPEAWRSVLYTIPIEIEFCFGEQEQFRQKIMNHIETFQK